jgi:hypothetical protein
MRLLGHEASFLALGARCVTESRVQDLKGTGFWFLLFFGKISQVNELYFCCLIN